MANGGQCPDCHGDLLSNIFHSRALHQDWKNNGNGRTVLSQNDVYRSKVRLICKQAVREGVQQYRYNP
eukprot:4539014-Heterocapsa_arctica.AAC.1